MKTLVIGGYGNFGARICRALSGDDSMQLLVGGRSHARAATFAKALGHGAQGVFIDISAPDLAQSFTKLGVELVIHTAGPFQSQDYAVAQAAAQAGAHYIDLADGRRFVCDFQAYMNESFMAAGRTAVSGASTVPALSSAVVDHLCSTWHRIDAIDVCIAPAQSAPRGLATMAAVLNYCGAPIRVWDDGRWQYQLGWARPKKVCFKRLRPRLGALCDIPDLELFPDHYQVAQHVMFRAALEVGLTQRAFAFLAALRAQGLLQEPERFAKIFYRLAGLFDFLGTKLGGMVVQVKGLDAAGQNASSEWHISADHDLGPEIPCMAAILLARRLAHGHTLPAGAYPCVGVLDLAEFEPLFAQWGMQTDTVKQ